MGAVALADALEADRQRQVCELYGVDPVFVAFWGPVSRGCHVGIHEYCHGRFYVLGAPVGPCMCKCHATSAPEL